MRVTSIAALGLALLAVVVPADAQQGPGSDFYYKLTTQFRGTGMAMDVHNGGDQNNQTLLDDDQDVGGQFWRFVPAGNGSYRLTTEFRGPNMCLDVEPSTNRPELRRCGNFTGQFWQVVRAGSWVRLKTTFRGPNMCLDIDPDSNQPEFRQCGNFTGQFWKLTQTDHPTR